MGRVEDKKLGDCLANLVSPKCCWYACVLCLSDVHTLVLVRSLTGNLCRIDGRLAFPATATTHTHAHTHTHIHTHTQ